MGQGCEGLGREGRVKRMQNLEPRSLVCRCAAMRQQRNALGDKVNARAGMTDKSMVQRFCPSRSMVVGFVGDTGERVSASRLRE
jgi:hypothetical protein